MQAGQRSAPSTYMPRQAGRWQPQPTDLDGGPAKVTRARSAGRQRPVVDRPVGGNRGRRRCQPIVPVRLFLGWLVVVPGGDKMWYRAAADLVVAVHLLFISFVVGGGFLASRWPRVISGTFLRR